METTDRSTNAATADMKEIETRIADADRRIAELFEERMRAVRDEELYRAAHGLPASDSAHDADMLEKLSALISDDSLRAYYINFMRGMLGISDRYRHRLAKGMRIAYSGVEGAYANIAARKIFPDGKAIGFPGFGAAYDAVTSGECDCAVLPIENSYAGDVGQVIDLMYTGSLHVSGMYTLRVSHSLLCVPGATADDIRKVVSHPQALTQCDNYIRRFGFETVQASSTADAAKLVAENADIHTAAIASRETAEIYGLEAIDHDINESSVNTTRFAVFSPSEDTSARGKDNRFILIFTVSNVAGALAKAISVIGSYGFSMSSLRSRPRKESAWEYYFFAEIEGDETGDAGRAMISELSRFCDTVKTVGHYCSVTDLSK